MYAAPDDGQVRIGYWFVYAKRSPLLAVFLEVQLCKGEEGCVAYGEEGDSRFVPPHRMRWSCAGMQHRMAAEVPFTEDSDIFVLHEVQPIPYEVFVSSFPHAASKQKSSRPPAAKRPKLPNDVLQRLQADFPWLTDSDLLHLCAHESGRRGNGGGGGGGCKASAPQDGHRSEAKVADDSPEGAADEGDDLDPEQVVEDLDALREAAYDPSEDLEHQKEAQRTTLVEAHDPTEDLGTCPGHLGFRERQPNEIGASAIGRPL